MMDGADVRTEAATWGHHSAELARRMQSVGNFSRLSRAREQVFYAEVNVDAVLELFGYLHILYGIYWRFFRALVIGHCAQLHRGNKVARPIYAKLRRSKGIA